MASPERCNVNHIEMMRLAEQVAKQSVCKRAQVGAVVMTKHGGQYTGKNHNYGRTCECEKGKTLLGVVHAEADVLSKAVGLTGDNAGGGVLYVTRQPCIRCARLIVDAGIHAVYYRDADDKTDGLEYLRAHGVEVDSGWITGRVAESWADRNGVAG